MGASTHSDEYQEFLKRLRAARLESGLTQLEVANRLGEPQSYVSKCESGERRVDIVELSKFAEIYGHSISYFMEEKSS
ncbi:helix-turn-helix transcriptional regulator [Leptolyngbya sp. FACHB-671]|uniref:helix-turn-helix domain-containing protein n=1 Tax=Leptolyngbya sp. FACHB-671 TaxID=2692812 RepID=UPI00168A1B59|nr:helix-turn-helix transcriptional regulator [Leptolyngbya sp. FACHB-671]MBD2067342.1 helix-turn-helix transcriptional regulator [Leptolyngbya sp. FACHB-671]